MARKKQSPAVVAWSYRHKIREIRVSIQLGAQKIVLEANTKKVQLTPIQCSRSLFRSLRNPQSLTGAVVCLTRIIHDNCRQQQASPFQRSNLRRKCHVAHYVRLENSVHYKWTCSSAGTLEPARLFIPPVNDLGLNRETRSGGQFVRRFLCLQCNKRLARQGNSSSTLRQHEFVHLREN